MNPVVAVIAPGAMGAAVGKRLADNGLKVLTSLEGRSAETAARAKAAGMVAASDEEIAAADFILSILPPGDALSLAERFVPALTASNAKPVYVDCNAINPKTVERVAAAIAPTGSPFVDAGIIGPPPKPVQPGEDKLAGNTRIYASGHAAPRFAALRDYGLDIRVLDGAMSAASALKMSYAGITKGTQAIGAAMMLAAARAGSADESVQGTAIEPEGNVRLVQTAIGNHAAEGLSLGRRNARDRGLRRRRSGGARTLRGRRGILRAVCGRFRGGQERRDGAGGLSRQKSVRN